MDAFDLSLTVVLVSPSVPRYSPHDTCSGVDFDDEELPYTEPNKSTIKVLLTVPIFVRVVNLIFSVLTRHSTQD